jgi:hypothetical protein
MCASHKIKIAKFQIAKFQENGHSNCPAFWRAPPPRIEAIALLQMLSRGATVEEIRELIAIPSETEQILRFGASRRAATHRARDRVSRTCRARVRTTLPL